MIQKVSFERKIWEYIYKSLYYYLKRIMWKNCKEKKEKCILENKSLYVKVYLVGLMKLVSKKVF